MDEASREILFWNNGIRVATRTENNCRYELYQIFAFYIEAQYKLPDLTPLRSIHFENTELLEPYLVEVEIPFIN